VHIDRRHDAIRAMLHGVALGPRHDVLVWLCRISYLHTHRVVAFLQTENGQRARPPTRPPTRSDAAARTAPTPLG